MLINRKILFFLIFLSGVNSVYSQNTEFVYTKDSYNFDSDLVFDDNDIPFEEQCKRQIKKNSKCYSNLTDYSLSYNGHSVLFVTNEDGSTGYALLEDLKNKKSDSIPTTIANEPFISSWTYDIMYSNSVSKLFYYEPYWKNEWKTSIGEKWQDCLFPSYFVFKQNEVYVYSYNQTERLFLIKDVEINNEYIKIYVTNKKYEDYYKPTKTECFVKYIEPYSDYVFYLKQDGDYLSVYLNNLDNKLIELAKGDVKLSHECLTAITYNESINLNSVRFPRHADGTCDYDNANVSTTAVADGSPDMSTEEVVISKPAPVMGKTARVTENLRLRSDDKTTAEVVTTLVVGTRVKVLAPGKAETIDGIASNWVKVEVLPGAKDKDGKLIRAGTTGWCYGGYLE